MRIAHFADLHYGTKNLDEADRCFSTAVDCAMTRQVDVAIISGDASDHGLELHEPATVRLLMQVRRLADHCPVLMLQGTFLHEPLGMLAIFRLLGARYPVHVADCIQQVALTDKGWHASTGWRFNEVPAGARLLVSCVPTVNKAMVAAVVGATEAAQATGEHLAALLAGFAPINLSARSLGIPTVGVSHGTVFGSISEHGVPMASYDHEFTTGTLFAAQTQAFMLGHIHRHQAWTQETTTGRQCIAYAGSIGRFHYGEEGEKGFLLWTVSANHAEYTLEPTPARRTLDIVFEGKPDLEALREAVAAHEINGADVRVRWTVAEEDRQAVDRGAISRLLAGAAHIKWEGRIVPVTRARAPGITQLGTLADKVRKWAQLTGVDPACVLDRLQALQQGSATEIAERVLREAACIESEAQ
jgi:exonuclease SbcD